MHLCAVRLHAAVQLHITVVFRARQLVVQNLCSCSVIAQILQGFHAVGCFTAADGIPVLVQIAFGAAGGFPCHDYCGNIFAAAYILYGLHPAIRLVP